MRIAVISDTHNRLPGSLLASIAGAEEIWHLGDVCDEEVLLKVEGLGPRVRVVLGNCDGCEAWPAALNLEVEGFKVCLVHKPPRQAEAGTDLLLHGHTHVSRDQMVNGTRFLNPGPVTRPRGGVPPSFAWLDLTRGKGVSWRIERL